MSIHAIDDIDDCGDAAAAAGTFDERFLGGARLRLSAFAFMHHMSPVSQGLARGMSGTPVRPVQPSRFPAFLNLPTCQWTHQSALLLLS